MVSYVSTGKSDEKVMTHLAQRAEFPLKWNLKNTLSPYLKSCHSLLGIGTHSLFLKSMDSLDFKKVSLLAKGSSLTVLGETYDLIFNQHNLFNAKEVASLLTEGGYFITEQIGGLNECELYLWLNVAPITYSNWSLRHAINELREAGLDIIEAKDDVSFSRFYDIKAIIAYLQSSHSPIPNFSVETYADRLISIHGMIDQKGYIDITRHRFLIIAKK